MSYSEEITKEQREAMKTYLSRYSAFVEMHDRYLTLLENSDSRLLSVTAQMEETRASGTAHDAMGDQVATLHERIEKLNYADNRVGESLDRISDLIFEVSELEPDAGKVLSHLYLREGRIPELDEVAEHLGYSESHVKRLHRIGLETAIKCRMSSKHDTF